MLVKILLYRIIINILDSCDSEWCISFVNYFPNTVSIAILIRSLTFVFVFGLRCIQYQLVLHTADPITIIILFP